MRTREPIWSPPFAALSAITLCFFLSGSMLIPILPRHLTLRGAHPYQVGIVIGALSLSAVGLRPFIGREMDRRGRRLFLVGGLAFSALACAGYTVVPGIWTVVPVRLIHGVAIACFYPAASTLTADLTPPSRRAEAISYFSLFLFAGLAMGPALGEHFALKGTNHAFIVAAVLALIGLVLSPTLREPPRDPNPPVPGPLLNRAAFFPALVVGLAAISFAGTDTFVPLYVRQPGGPGSSRLFYTTMAVTIMVMRLFTGRAADRFGRAAVIVPGTVLCGVALSTIAISPRQPVLLTGAVVMGMGWGLLFPGVFAVLMDRVSPAQRGAATGTFTAAFDLSFGLGQVLLGGILQTSNFHATFAAAGLGGFASMAVFLSLRKRSDAVYPALAPKENYLPT
jgi:MFS family permease